MILYSRIEMSIHVYAGIYVSVYISFTYDKCTHV